MFVEGNRSGQHKKGYPFKTGHNTKHIIAMGNNNILSSFLLLGETTKQQTNHWDLANDALEHSGSKMPDLTAVPKMSSSLGEITKHESYQTLKMHKGFC